MKGKLIYIMSIVILIIGFIVFFEMMKPSEKQGTTEIRNMPEMYITTGDETFNAVKGPYCWRSGNQAVCTDASGNPFDYKQHSPPIQLTKDSSIDIIFSKKPNQVSTIMFDSNHNTTSIKELSFSSPTEKGLYGFTVDTNWKNGQITFIFLVEVQ